MSKQNDSIEKVVQESMQGDLDRRSFLRRTVCLGLSSSAAYALLNETTAAAQSPANPRMTTMALGEEGNPGEIPRNVIPREYWDRQRGAKRPGSIQEGSNGTAPQKKATTMAVGEESSPRPTTMAIGEEGNPQPTTMAVGEESNPGGGTTRRYGEESNPTVTTRAVGEEQSTCPSPNPTTKAVGEESSARPTTLAQGEEGRPSTITQVIGESGNPKTTTRANGEEGAPLKRTIRRSYEMIPRPWKSFRRW